LIKLEEKKLKEAHKLYSTCMESSLDPGLLIH